MSISASLQDLLIGIATSIITGVAVWLWQKIQHTQILNRNANFFDLKPGDECLIVLTQYREQNATSHGVVECMVDAVKLIHSLGCNVKVAPFDKAIEPPGEMTEICLGGPDANQRTKSHLTAFLKGVQFYSYNDETIPSALVVRKKVYEYEKGKREYAILAKFRPKPTSKPVFLICGQTQIANKGAMYYLAQNYVNEIRRKYGGNNFCLITCVPSPWTYGHKSVELVEDITKVAFKA